MTSAERGRSFRTHHGWVALGATVIGIAVVEGIGQIIGASSTVLLAQVLVFALYATATNLLLGYGGIISFGQSAFFGIGAYVVAMNYLHFGLPAWLAMVLAPFVSGAVALLAGLLFLRSRGLYFALLTLSFTMFLYTGVLVGSNVTDGENGVFGISVPRPLASNAGMILFVVVLCGLGMLALWGITRSRLGLSLRATRSQETRVASLGVSTTLVRLEAFALSGFFCGMAGVLYVVINRAAFPSVLYWVDGGYPVVMAVIGGMGTFFGPAVGAIIYWVGYSELSIYTKYWEIILGAVIVSVAILLPEGILGSAVSLVQRAKGGNQQSMSLSGLVRTRRALKGLLTRGEAS